MTGDARVAADAFSYRVLAVGLLQLFALAVMVIPSDTVLSGFGAVGYPASLLGLFTFVVLSVAVVLGVRDRDRVSAPVRIVLCVLWISVLASYLAMDRGLLTATELAGADRMLIRFAVVTGVAIVAAEWLSSLEDVRRVLRALVWGGAFCGVVAGLQYWFDLDLAQYLRDLPGFAVNSDNPAITMRDGLNRVTGTAITPIELGVVAGMLIPIAIYLGLHDRARSPLIRWAPVALISLGVLTSVSRSAIISLVVGFGVMVVLMPPLPRLGALFAVPFAVAAAFMTAHGLIGTLAELFTAGTNDSSIVYRINDYPHAAALWEAAPWFGQGGGTYIAENQLFNFDNQFLLTAVELGTVGIAALSIFFLLPPVSALIARRRSADPDLRLLCAALAGAGFAGAACSLTFDAAFFPMFINVTALIIGLIGVCWRLAERERESRVRTGPFETLV